MSGLKEEKKTLAERMRVLEAAVTQSNSALRDLEQCMAASKSASPTSTVVSINVIGFDEEVSSVLTASVSGTSADPSSSKVSSGKPACFIMDSLSGSIQISQSDGSELGSWPLAKMDTSPVETDVVLGASDADVQRVLKVRITAVQAGQLQELVAGKKKEIGKFDDERKAVNKKLVELRQKVACGSV